MNDLIGHKTSKDDLAERIFYTEEILRDIFESYSISEIRTPALESSNLFKRSVGDASDIVNKELYSFLDKNEKSITLRPEGTASVIRSVIEKKIDNDTHKLWYLGPMWRYERPQKGRYRQFNQAGVEILGYPEGLAELEIVSLICSINRALGIDDSVLKINHLGNNETKQNYCKALEDFLIPLSSKLDAKDLERLNKNPLRVLDSKNLNTQAILKDAPKIIDYLSEDAISILNEQVNWLKEKKFLPITIEGHADEQGTREYNLALGARRATAVREFLLAKGIEQDRISIVTYGKERPLRVCSNEECWSKNRRAVTVVGKKIVEQ